MGTREHKENAAKHVKVGIITLSSTRSLANDKSGHWISEQAGKNGHKVVFHQVIPDDTETIADAILYVINNYEPQVLLLTGGTGITKKDVTVEAVRPLFKKELTAFGVLFAQLSFEEIGSAALLSRATAGTIDNTILFCMPGSLNACKLACEALIFPELGHLVRHVCEG
ncbi:MogA/MoaB family molybdenum cofactor biosynthesis protein [Desulfonema magnum]|uniref:Molybdenum cofactor biosynthesis protein B n=1 Tax=Desulfonema magnum TaxID=45655 RepID=A0A975BMI7_9BACT|nr:MogA/MoaB family molybdenum cofactor biosynthesis protein [Desulfonema magnum]QTA87744.1 Molybdenum cofactor biosynthesis protein [Desulfonema magnum]